METIFWLLTAFFSSIGVVEFVFFVSRIGAQKFETPLVLVFEKDTADGLEIKLNHLFSQINFNCDIAIVDVGVIESQKEICKKIAAKHNVAFLEHENLTQFLKEREGEKCLN